jgi:hypothetical protein
MPATAWDLFCSARFLVISHWLTANSSFGHRSCSLSGWQYLVVLLCSARFIFSACLSQASAFLWPAMWLALRYRGPNNALLTQTAMSLRTGVIIHRPARKERKRRVSLSMRPSDRRSLRVVDVQLPMGQLLRALRHASTLLLVPRSRLYCGNSDPPELNERQIANKLFY